MRIRIAYAYAENKEYFNDYAAFHIKSYLLESLVGECNIDGATTLDDIENFISSPDDTKTSLKIHNLKNAMTELFPDIYTFVDGKSRINVDQVTPNFIKRIHKHEFD